MSALREVRSDAALSAAVIELLVVALGSSGGNALGATVERRFERDASPDLAPVALESVLPGLLRDASVVHRSSGPVQRAVGRWVAVWATAWDATSAGSSTSAAAATDASTTTDASSATKEALFRSVSRRCVLAAAEPLVAALVAALVIHRGEPAVHAVLLRGLRALLVGSRVHEDATSPAAQRSSSGDFLEVFQLFLRENGLAVLAGSVRAALGSNEAGSADAGADATADEAVARVEWERAVLRRYRDAQVLAAEGTGNLSALLVAPENDPLLREVVDDEARHRGSALDASRRLAARVAFASDALAIVEALAVHGAALREVLGDGALESGEDAWEALRGWFADDSVACAVGRALLGTDRWALREEEEAVVTATDAPAEEGRAIGWTDVAGTQDSQTG